MPIVSVKKERLFQALGKKYSFVVFEKKKKFLYKTSWLFTFNTNTAPKEFEDLCFAFGVEVDEDHDDDGSEVFKFEIGANRYDLLCEEGISRAFNVFLGNMEPPVFTTKKPENPIKMTGFFSSFSHNFSSSHSLKKKKLHNNSSLWWDFNHQAIRRLCSSQKHWIQCWHFQQLHPIARQTSPKHLQKKDFSCSRNSWFGHSETTLYIQSPPTKRNWFRNFNFFIIFLRFANPNFASSLCSTCPRKTSKCRRIDWNLWKRYQIQTLETILPNHQRITKIPSYLWFKWCRIVNATFDQWWTFKDVSRNKECFHRMHCYWFDQSLHCVEHYGHHVFWIHKKFVFFLFCDSFSWKKLKKKQTDKFEVEQVQVEYINLGHLSGSQREDFDKFSMGLLSIWLSKWIFAQKF